MDAGSSGLLSDSTRLWRVRDGAVDLFLVRVEDHLPWGARYPVARVPAGEAIFSPGTGGEFALVAQPGPACRVEAESWQTVSEHDLELWMERLGSALGAIPPAEFVSLEEERSVELREGAAVGAAGGLLWVSHVAGASRLMGLSANGAISGQTPVPASRAAWLVTGSGTCLRRVQPRDSEIAAGVEVFHRHILAALAHRSGEQESRFAERVRRRAEADQAYVRVAHGALAGVLKKSAAGTAIEASDPLLAAAQAAGEALGISITAAPAARRSAARDPIENIARASSVRVRRVSLNRGWWRRDGGPLVGYAGEAKAPVALLPDGPRHYQLFDPATGSRRRVTAAVAAELKSYAHSLYRPFPAEKLNFTKLAGFGIRGLGRDAGVILLTGALSGLLGLVTPVAAGVLFDSVIPASDRSQVSQIFGILVAAAISTWLLSLVQGFAMLRVEGKMDASLQAALWDRLLSLPVTFYRGYSAGDLAGRSLSITSIREILTGNALTAILTGVFSIFSVGLLFHFGAALAIPACGVIALSFLVTTGAAVGQIRVQRRFAEMAGKVAGLLPQLLGGIAKIRVAGAEERAFARWAVRFAEQKRLAVRSRRIGMAMGLFFPLFQAAAMVALFSLLARPAINGDGALLTTGAFLAFQAAFLQVLAGASQLGTAMISVVSIVPLYERARPILESLPEVRSNQADPGEISGDVEMAHVAFRYQPGLPQVLKDVSLHIRAGQFAAIVGATGSGKSSIFRLLLGFETPESGSVFCDGQDLAGLDVQAIRRQAGVVLQQSGVLGGDLFSNIVGASPLTIDDAWEAARMAGLEDDIRAMPMGMHTVLPDGGLGLSGGQRQRLQIARAVVNRPRLILFDEATSALDNQTQAIAMESLSRLKATRIVIAHRLSTIRNADCIFVLNQGVIEESGTYDELMARNGFFATLARRQLT